MAHDYSDIERYAPDAVANLRGIDEAIAMVPPSHAAIALRLKGRREQMLTDARMGAFELGLILQQHGVVDENGTRTGRVSAEKARQHDADPEVARIVGQHIRPGTPTDAASADTTPPTGNHSPSTDPEVARLIDEHLPPRRRPGGGT